MNTESKMILASILAPAAGATFVVSTLAMLSGVEPFYSCYYSFAWWSYIAFIEAFLYCRGKESLLFENPLQFLVLLPLSVTVWLVFEAFNFRLSNWHYINIPCATALRWVGYTVAYSTVVPGILSTAALLKSFGVLKNSQTTPLADPKKMYKPLVVTGVLFLVLPLVWPEYFFPLVWGAFIFLLEPVNHWAGAPSLLRDWGNGSLRQFYLLLLAGAICGLLWELWNFWAGSKWIYSIPHFGYLKVFEMPLFGFLGFPPFAVECYSITASFFLLLSKIREKYLSGQALGAYVAVGILLIVLFDLLVFAGIDRFTVISFQHLSFGHFVVRPRK